MATSNSLVRISCGAPQCGAEHGIRWVEDIEGHGRPPCSEAVIREIGACACRSSGDGLKSAQPSAVVLPAGLEAVSALL